MERIAIGSMIRRLVASVLALAAIALWGCLGVRAADGDTGGSFLDPFPEGEVYKVTVVGDDFADGLLGGLNDGFANDTRLELPKQVRPFAGIMSSKFDDKLAELAQAMPGESASIVIVMVGENDRIALRSSSNRRVAVMSAEWRAEYGRRLDKVMKAVKVKNAGVYWVGLPNVSRPLANDQVQGMNEVIRERAYQNGFRYIDSYAGFADESGAYSAYGPDLAGKIRVLRQGDGEHFTDAGNAKLAHFVEKEMRRDLNKAKAERSIPLAGNEAEQALINPDNAVKAPAPSSPAAAAGPAKEEAAKPLVSAPAADPSADQAADNGKIAMKVVNASGREESLTVEIVRPAIPATVIALMTRRQASGQMGDLLVDQIGDGLTLMNSVTPSGQKSAGKLSPSQAPYFRLLVKGERLQPKPGRADDFTWQKPDTSSVIRPALAPRG
ncbi:MAG TPA: GDSL-type esterase/lipase family protein [Hyphomicrobium sp.]|nr:GDSL-type esterase/lipase family protein [Hyphomicrobium sp.]